MLHGRDSFLAKPPGTHGNIRHPSKTTGCIVLLRLYIVSVAILASRRECLQAVYSAKS